VRHLVGQAGLLHGRDRVAAADDGDGAFRREAREAVGDGKGAGGELVELEDAGGAVPDDGLAVAVLLGFFGGGGAIGGVFSGRVSGVAATRKKTARAGKKKTLSILT
jgi:hypothetical protein